MLSVRKLNDNDYDDHLVKWWRDWRWTPPPRDFLPEHGAGGFMVCDSEQPVVAGYIYMTNSSVAWVEFIVSNMEYKHKQKRRDAIDLLMVTMSELVKISGKKYIYATLKNQSLINTYLAHGFEKGSSNSQEMVKKIWQYQQQ
jgi:hypothetical protein